FTRVAQRPLARTTGIWHNWTTGATSKRSLTSTTEDQGIIHLAGDKPQRRALCVLVQRRPHVRATCVLLGVGTGDFGKRAGVFDRLGMHRVDMPSFVSNLPVRARTQPPIPTTSRSVHRTDEEI